MLILLIFCYLLIAIESTVCPEKQIVFPCVCHQNAKETLPDITCSRSDVNVSQVLTNIRLNSGTDNELQFGRLFWTNGQSINVTNNFFAGVSFEKLYLGTKRKYANILHISSGAFNGIAHRIKSIVIRSQDLMDERNLFDALRRLTNVEYIGVEGIGLQTIPENAFKTVDNCHPLTDCVQKRLTSISFRVGVTESLIFLAAVESQAFYDLPNLTSLDMSSHDIRRIGARAFAFAHKSDQLLTIDLSKQWDRHLAAHSFDVRAFEGTNRPLYVDLFGNKFLDSLSEPVFRPLLESDSRNRLRLGMKMKCDCRLYWLWHRRHTFQPQFIEWVYDDLPPNQTKHTIQCSEGVENFWLRNESHFINCDNDLKNTEL